MRHFILAIGPALGGIRVGACARTMNVENSTGSISIGLGDAAVALIHVHKYTLVTPNAAKLGATGSKVAGLVHIFRVQFCFLEDFRTRQPASHQAATGMHWGLMTPT